jgi:hypothetical protein
VRASRLACVNGVRIGIFATRGNIGVGALGVARQSRESGAGEKNNRNGGGVIRQRNEVVA